MMSYFRSKPVTPNVSNIDPKSSAVSHGGVPGNLFPKGTIFDFYVYIAESENFNGFENENALYYSAQSIEYGDWTIGDNKDGMLTHTGNLELTSV